MLPWPLWVSASLPSRKTTNPWSRPKRALSTLEEFQTEHRTSSAFGSESCNTKQHEASRIARLRSDDTTLAHLCKILQKSREWAETLLKLFSSKEESHDSPVAVSSRIKHAKIRRLVSFSRPALPGTSKFPQGFPESLRLPGPRVPSSLDRKMMFCNDYILIKS